MSGSTVTWAASSTCWVVFVALFVAVAPASAAVGHGAGPALDDASAEAATADPTLAVTVEANETDVEGAVVVFYDADWTRNRTRRVNASRTVRFAGVPAGDGYVELYGPAGDYWGTRAVTVDGDTSVTLRRSAPRVASVEVADGGDGTVPVGETATVTARVGNDGPERPVRVRMGVDTDGDGAADATVTRGDRNTRVPRGEVGDYGYDAAATTTGPVSVRVAVQARVAGSWVRTDHTDWTPAFTAVEPVDGANASVTVLSVDGAERGAAGFAYDGHVNSVRVAVADADGDPVTRPTLPLTVEVPSFLGGTAETTLTHEGDGVYAANFSGNRTALSTQYWRLSVGIDDRTRVVEVPLVDRTGWLERPVRGWVDDGHRERVRVTGENYTAFRLVRDADTPPDEQADHAWLVLRADGTLVREEFVRQRAAKAAQVSANVGIDSDDDVELYGETLPDAYDATVTYGRVGEALLVVRDSAAELAGAVIATTVTGGSSRFAGESLKQATGHVARELFEDVVENYLKESVVGSEVAENPLAAVEKAIRLKAEAELRQSADQSRHAAAVLRDRDAGAPWAYENATRYWTLVNESSVDGYLYMTVREEMLPDAGVEAQLRQVGKAGLEGGTGVPIELLVTLVKGDQFGYLSTAARETALLRERRAQMARAFGDRGRAAQQTALEQYGNATVVYGSEPGRRASISMVEGPTGEFRVGDRVSASVAVTNTGSRAGTFFVGYSPWTVENGSRTYFSNHGRTGRELRVPAGKTVTTDVAWTVQSDAPPGSYGVTVAAWSRKPPGDDARRLANATRRNAFSVVREPAVAGVSIDVLRPVRVGEPTRVVVTMRNDGDEPVTRIVPLEVTGTYVTSGIVTVPANGTATLTYRHTFDAPGAYDVAAAGASTTVTVRETTPRERRPGAPQAVDSCRVVDEPGQYELVADLDGSVDGACLHVRADGVTIDGNGHTVSGSGAPDSVGVLVYNASRGESVDRADALSDVVVTDLTVEGWADGVQIGDIAGTATSATVRNVVVRDNTGSGVDLTEVENATLANVTAVRNRFGVSATELSDSMLVRVTANENDEVGVALFQDAYGNVLTELRATENGPGGYASSGLYLSTDVAENVVTDAYVAANHGPGVFFSDSYRNVLRASLVASNDGPGIRGYPANRDALRNVTVRDNGGPALLTTEGEFDADGLKLDGVASLSFAAESVTVDRVSLDALPSAPPGGPVGGAAVEVTNVAERVDVTLRYGERVDNDSVAVWRFDGANWARVPGVSVDPAAGTVSAPVTADGVVVATAMGSEPARPPAGDETGS
ncbi:right-handed parallel beta-helix repeat-containing protein [Halobacterium litoreum]|uniref:Right-handed parallel beta-helix repeat-containing protein n=1 Tax=Halobacterium litoreum TaxID=2039234 RepID=A0ABD5NI41_9EURY|nr:right-handed parallel beta-helix repeat-containing protein [Halobacterium litoreum]UHH12249.1 right-handed parallel beta-helix repeat-containing protein [Halobacterium litoreum]